MVHRRELSEEFERRAERGREQVRVGETVPLSALER